MQETNQKLTGFAAEIRNIAGWAWALAAIGFLGMQYVFNVVVAHQPDAPPAWARPLMGLSVGLLVAFYMLMIGYVNRDFKLVARWAWILAAIGFLSMQFVFNVVIARQPDAPPAWAGVLLGLLVGLILTCYLLLIGYVNRDSGRRGMSRVLWTTVSVLGCPTAWESFCTSFSASPSSATARSVDTRCRTVSTSALSAITS